MPSTKNPPLIRIVLECDRDTGMWNGEFQWPFRTKGFRVVGSVFGSLPYVREWINQYLNASDMMRLAIEEWDAQENMKYAGGDR